MYMICFLGIFVWFFGGYSSVEGCVEVFMNNVWGIICDVGWDLVDMCIVCNILFGYRYMYLLIGMNLIVCY